MITKDFRKRLLEAGSALQVVALVGAGVGFAAVAAPAAAQDYTAGAISGTVYDSTGATVSGATVTLRSNDQGFTRTATTSANGTFRFNGLQTGGYDVVVESPGADSFTATDVRVLPSQTAALTIDLTTGGEAIVVTGARISNEFTNTQTGINVDVEELVKTVPISRDLTSVALLAPGTSGGDSAFGNLASIGGSSVAENAYYINGLNITNFDNYLGAANVPFDFYKTIEVKSGGYPAEFGRATGGVINTTTKSGGNEFFAAAHLNWSPDWLRDDSTDLLSCGIDGVCNPTTNRAYDTVDSLTASIEAGGPIIKDRLFAYGLLEMRRETSLTNAPNSGLAFDRISTDPFWGLKIDAYPLDEHHLEFTAFNSRQTVRRSDLSYNEDAYGVPNYGLASSVSDFQSGGVSFVGKYTGQWTDWLQVSGAYGRMRDRFDNTGVAGDAGNFFFQNGVGYTYLGQNNGGLYNGQAVLGQSFPYATQREFYRADADLYFSAFGEHHIRFGYDQEETQLTRNTVRNGGLPLYAGGLLSDAAYFANTGGIGGAGAAIVLRPGRSPEGTPIEDREVLVEINYFNSGGTFTGTNKAFYIQDEWDVTDRLTLNLGVRRDDFSVNRADGVELVNLDKNYAPRLGLTYDVGAQNQGRFKAYYGVYYLPIASNTAFRMTGSEYYIRERYVFEGIDADGLPILGDQVTNLENYQAVCPFRLTTQSSGFNCNVTGDGSVADPSALIASNLKATKMDEIIVGYEHNFYDVPVFGELQVGLNYIRRRLKLNAEDAAIDAAVLAYCDAEGIAGCSDTWTGFHQYTILNPGQELTVALDGLDGRTVTFTPEQLGYPAASRKYDSVEFIFERPFDGVWALQGSYTWSKARGNSEGYVQSDFGQDDAGITQDFDQPGFLDGAYGYLPSDRRHRIKLFGAVSPFEGFTIGTNMSLTSPRPLSCFGHHPTDPFANAYGAASRYCVNANGEPELSPRGTAQESDWLFEADLKFAYAINLSEDRVVRLRADVFNVFNKQAVLERNQVGELDTRIDGGWYPPNPNYGQPQTYQSPRQVRLGVDIEF